MLPWLLRTFPELVPLEASGDSRVLLTARAAAASLAAFLAAVTFGPLAIGWLKARFRERIDSRSELLNALHAGKESTPTMGGLFIVGSLIVATLLCAELSNPYVLLALVVLIGFGAIGAADDWIKQTGRSNGLSARRKFVCQIAVAAAVSLGLWAVHRGQPDGLTFVWPVGGAEFPLGGALAAWGLFLLVASSNGVNLTDGLDGLASGCVIVAAVAFTALAYLSGHAVLADYLSIPHIAGAGEMAVVMAGLVGAMLGFLWFNCHPAQVFMGDAGSLPLGALLGFAALVTRQEVLLAVVGGVFVIETLSVMVQVGGYRLTGRRLLACSPLHNHLVLSGHAEHKVVVRFWIAATLLAVLAVASLKIR